MQGRSAETRQIAGRLSEAVQNRVGRAIGNRKEQVGGDAKDRIVIDVIKDMLPASEQTTLADVVSPGIRSWSIVAISWASTIAV